MTHTDLVRHVLRGHKPSNPKAGPVSWALDRLFIRLCKEFADALEVQEDAVFDREAFLTHCGLNPEEMKRED